MKVVIDVQFKPGGKAYYFDPGPFEVKAGDGVIVETARGIEFGDVKLGNHEVDEEKIIGELKEVQRIATPEDRVMRDTNRAKEKDAYRICQKKISDRNLEMKLVDVEYNFNGSKIVFFFTADGRVDFRELVKDLASVFKTRIELRQIGVRDEAKMLGGLGSCGRPVCCQAFLNDFQPVSIKMAKEQNLSLSPTKISGICGRLMCCLKYEQDCYESMRKQMPKVGKEVITPDGQGTVMENNVITEKTTVKLFLPDGSIDVRQYPFRELERTDNPRPEIPQRPPKVESKKDETPKPPRRPRVKPEKKPLELSEIVGSNTPAVEEAEAANAAEEKSDAPGDGANKRKRSRRGRRHKPKGPKPEGTKAEAPAKEGE